MEDLRKGKSLVNLLFNDDTSITLWWDQITLRKTEEHIVLAASFSANEKGSRNNKDDYQYFRENSTSLTQIQLSETFRKKLLNYKDRVNASPLLFELRLGEITAAYLTYGFENGFAKVLPTSSTR